MDRRVNAMLHRLQDHSDFHQLTFYFTDEQNDRVELDPDNEVAMQLEIK